jgi:hypothetical protein
MIQIQTITSDFYQRQTVNYNNSSIVFTLKYSPQQLVWYIEQLVYGGVTIQGMRVSTNLNILRQFKNLLPFGMACLTLDDNDPTQQQDFSSGYANLYILDPTDVLAVEATINGS